MEHFAAILLAGGESLRMGKNKASMLIDGQTLLERTLSILDPVVSHIIVMLNPHQSIPPVQRSFAEKTKFGRDSRRKQGPLQGIADGLPLIPDNIDCVFVVTCDLPYLTTEWLSSMKAALVEEIDVVHAVDEGITNPLLALYRRKVLLNADKLLADKQYRPIRLWDGFRLVGLSPPSDNPKVCKDVNTPEEFMNAQRELVRH